ncbi:MAG: hypothetical protein Q6363_006060 [Candidatus Njordarchaeota archaeon]
MIVRINMMIELRDLGIVWRLIKKHEEISINDLKAEIEKIDPSLVQTLDNILLRLHELYLVDYTGESVKVSKIISREIIKMPCLGCEKLKTCRPGSKNNPFRCEKFVRWFIEEFVE